MTSLPSPRAILDREEARTRAELAAVRARLAARLSCVVDPAALVRRHPVALLAAGAAAGFLAVRPLLTPARILRGLLRSASGALPPLLAIAVRTAFQHLSRRA